MSNTQPKYHLPTHLFIKRLSRNLFIGFIIIVASLGLGMIGYHHYEKMTWVDAYVNAAMILSGMGQVKTLATSEGKIFAGTYALFSGIMFLVTIAFIFTPVVHHFFHKFHIDEQKK